MDCGTNDNRVITTQVVMLFTLFCVLRPYGGKPTLAGLFLYVPTELAGRHKLYFMHLRN